MSEAKPRGPRRKWTAVALTVLFLVQGVATVSSTHRTTQREDNPIVGAAFDPVEPPRTDQSMLDRQLASIVDAHNERVQTLNGTSAQIQANASSLVAGRIFEDHVGRDGRIGGFGEWSQLGKRAWNTSSELPLKGNLSYSFSDERGLYPSAATAYFVTPRIDLRHVPLTQHTANRQQVGPIEQQVLANPSLDAIFLALTHRFNLANGVDGARVEVLDELPEQGRLPTQATPLLPVAFEPLNGGNAGPTYAPVTRFQDEEHYNLNPASQGTGFTGASDPVISVFDLTPFAGREIWIAFVVKTHLQPGEELYFDDENRFQISGPFGWQVDDILVRGPLEPQHMRIETVSALPGDHDLLTGISTIPPGQDVELRVLSQNAGGLPSNVTLDVALLRQGEDTPTLSWRSTFPLEPAETRETNIPARFNGAGNYVIRASLSGSNGTQTYTNPDRQRDLLVRAHTIEDIKIEVEKEPFYLRTHGEGLLWVNVTNEGNTPGTYDVAISLRNVTTTASAEFAREFLDGPAVRRITLDPGTEQTLRWKVNPTLPQRYIVEARITRADGDNTLITSASTLLNVEQGPNILFHDDYRTAPNVTLASEKEATWSAHRFEYPQWPYLGTGKLLWYGGSGGTSLLGYNTSRTNVAQPQSEPGADRFVLEFTYFYAASSDLPRAPLQVRLHYPPATNRSLPVEQVSLTPPRTALSTLTESVIIYQAELTQSDGQPGWRHVTIPLDEHLRTIRPPDTIDGGWAPSRIEVEFTSTAPNVFLSTMRADHTPIGAYERATLFEYNGETASGQIQPRPAAPVVASFPPWSQVNETFIANAGKVQNDVILSPWEPRELPVKAPAPGARLVSPPIPLLDAPHPILTFEHRYGTAVSFSPRVRVDQVAVVEAQALQPNGTWGPWHRIDPVGGYPTTSKVADFGGPLLGKGYFAPADYVDRGGWRFERHGGTQGWERATFDLTMQPALLHDLSETHVIRLGFHLTPTPQNAITDPSRGWWIRPITVLPNPSMINDLAIEAVELNVPYDHATLGVPPSIEVPVQVTVSNQGMRAASQAEIALLITDANGQTVSIRACEETGQDACVIALGEDENRTVTFGWTPPPGAHEISAQVKLQGLKDEDPSNDVGTYLDHKRVPTRAVIGAKLQIEASPAQSGLVARILRPLVTNVGNVPLTNLTLDRTILFEGGLPVADSNWTLQGPIPPDAKARSLIDPILAARDVRDDGVTFDKDLVWTPTVPGSYAVLSKIKAATGISLADARTQLTADAAFFRDDFNDETFGGIGEWETSEDQAWQLHQGPNDGSKYRFRFGDAVGTYPSSANASLVSPIVDLSTAKTARLTLITNLSLEERYDAGLVEATTDGGKTWTRLEPEPSPLLPVGYPGSVAPSNGLNPTHDPMIDIRAFTGRTADASPPAKEAGGLIPVTFALHQLDDMTHSVDLARLDLPPSLETESEFVLGSGRTFTDPTWHAEAFPEELWTVENLTYRNPLPHGSTQMRVMQSTADSSIILPIPKDPLSRNNFVLDIWDWREGVSPILRNGSWSYIMKACAPSAACGQIFYLTGDRVANIDLGFVNVVEQQGDWTRRRIDIGRAASVLCPSCTDQVKLSITVYNGNSNTPDQDHYQKAGGGNVAPWIIGQARLINTTHENVVSTIDPDSPAWQGGIVAEKLPRNPIHSGFIPVHDEERSHWQWSPLNHSEARLVTPAIDLSGAAAETLLSFNHRTPDFDSNSLGVRVVEVQTLDPVTGAWSAWEPLYAREPPDTSLPLREVKTDHEKQRAQLAPGEHEATGYDRVFVGAPTAFFRQERELITTEANGAETIKRQAYSHSFGTTSGSWQDATFDISGYAGRTIRLAFHAAAPNGGPTGPPPIVWEISDVKVTGNAIEGRPIQFRVRAVTDENGNEGSWEVAEAVISGSHYGLNVRLMMETQTNKTTDPRVNLTASVHKIGKVLPPKDLAIQLEGPVVLLGPSGAPMASNLLPLKAVIGPDRGDLVANASFQLLFPGDPGSYQVEAKLVELLPGGKTRPIPNDVPGFLSAMSLVTVYEPRRDIGLTADAPLEARPNENVTLRMTIHNQGTQHEEGTWRLALASPTAPACTFQGTFRLAPFSTSTIQENCLITNEGAHVLDATAETVGLAPATSSAIVHVSPRKVFLAEDFESASDPWRSRPTPSRESNPAAPTQGGNTGPPNSRSPRYGTATNSGANEWHSSDSDSHSGNRSWMFGPETDLYEEGARYGDFQDAYLESAAIDLRNVVGGHAFLSFWHRRSFSLGDGGVVEVRAIDNETGAPLTRWLGIKPVGGYPGVTQSIGTFVPPPGGIEGPPTCVPCHLNPLGFKTPAYTGIADDWEPALFDLSLSQLVGNLVQIRFRVGTMEATGNDGGPGGSTAPSPAFRPFYPQIGEGWFIDDVVVSAAALQLSPASQVLHQADGLTKSHFIRVENHGALDVEITGEIVPERSSAEAGDIFRVADVPHRIPGGQAQMVRIDAHAPTVQSGFSSEQRLALRVGVAELATLTELATLDLRLTPRAHPNLITRLEVANGARIETGVPSSILAVIENRGDVATSPTSLRLEAVYLPTGDIFPIGTAPLPSLSARALGYVAHLTWTPPPTLGSYLLRAIADPEGVNTNSQPADAIAEVRVEVVPLRRPDLRVVTLQAGPPGQPRATSAAEGDLVQFSAAILNGGSADAIDVTLHMFVGATIAKVERIARIAPGATASVLVNQFVPRGELVYAVEATTASVEMRTDNNRAEETITVVGAEARWQIPDQSTASQVTILTDHALSIRLMNTGTELRSLVLSTVSSRDLAVVIEPRLLVLEPGETAEVNVTARAENAPNAGSYEVTLFAHPVEKGLPAVLHIDVQVPQQHDIQLDVSSVVDGSEVGIILTNDGNADEQLLVRASSTASAAITEVNVTLPRRDTRVLSLDAVQPSATGEQMVTIEVFSNGIRVAKSATQIVVERSPTIELKLDAADPGLLLIHATGNAPVRVILEARTAGGVEARIDPPTLTMAPGEEATARVMIPGLPRQAGQRESVNITATVEQTGIIHRTNLELPPATSLVAITGAAYHAAGAATEGGIYFVVANAATQESSPFQVRFYVDGALTAVTQLEPIQAAGEAEIRIPWAPTLPTHSILVALEPLSAGTERPEAFGFLVEGEPTGGALSLQRLPMPPAVATIVMLMALAIVLRQRRRQ